MKKSDKCNFCGGKGTGTWDKKCPLCNGTGKSTPKPKKPTHKGLIRKLDKVFGEIVRSRGRCERCGREDGSLQTAHIFSRVNMATRWDLENALCLCYRDHLHFAHSNPVGFYDWLSSYYGELKLTQLRQRANAVKKWTDEELKILLGVLTNYKETMWK